MATELTPAQREWFVARNAEAAAMTFTNPFDMIAWHQRIVTSAEFRRLFDGEDWQRVSERYRELKEQS